MKVKMNYEHIIESAMATESIQSVIQKLINKPNDLDCTSGS